MNLLILGNGFEINFNENLNDFNNKFKQWILSFDTNDKIFDLCDKMTTISGELNQERLLKDNVLERCIKTLKSEIAKEKEDFTIENLLNQIGQKLSDYYKELGIIEMIEQTFNCLKSIIGHFVYIKTSKKCQKFPYNDFSFLKKILPPNYIFTTNYTNSIKVLREKWLSAYEEKPIPIVGFYNIHGEFNFEAEDKIIYSNLEINLTEKNSWAYFKQFF